MINGHLALLPVTRIKKPGFPIPTSRTKDGNNAVLDKNLNRPSYHDSAIKTCPE